eukprot:scaffold30230_cov22-Tisochrysis_lutea.AAC.1
MCAPPVCLQAAQSRKRRCAAAFPKEEAPAEDTEAGPPSKKQHTGQDKGQHVTDRGEGEGGEAGPGASAQVKAEDRDGQLSPGKQGLGAGVGSMAGGVQVKTEQQGAGGEVAAAPSMQQNVHGRDEQEAIASGEHAGGTREVAWGGSLCQHDGAPCMAPCGPVAAASQGQDQQQLLRQEGEEEKGEGHAGECSGFWKLAGLDIALDVSMQVREAGAMAALMRRGVGGECLFPQKHCELSCACWAACTP